MKDGKEVDTVTLVGRLFHACATVAQLTVPKCVYISV